MSAKKVAEAMGGAKTFRKNVKSEFDLVAAAMKGLPANAAYSVIDSGLLEASELYDLVIPRRTIERRRDENEPLTVIESDRLMRTVRVAVRALEALGNADSAKKWLRTPNRALHGNVPLTLLQTDLGASMVERTLGRLEHGVIS